MKLFYSTKKIYVINLNIFIIPTLCALIYCKYINWMDLKNLNTELFFVKMKYELKPHSNLTLNHCISWKGLYFFFICRSYLIRKFFVNVFAERAPIIPSIFHLRKLLSNFLEKGRSLAKAMLVLNLYIILSSASISKTNWKGQWQLKGETRSAKAISFIKILFYFSRFRFWTLIQIQIYEWIRMETNFKVIIQNINIEQI